MPNVSKACSEMNPSIRHSLLLASLNPSGPFLHLSQEVLHFSRPSGYPIFIAAAWRAEEGRSRLKSLISLSLLSFKINELCTNRWVPEGAQVNVFLHCVASCAYPCHLAGWGLHNFPLMTQFSPRELHLLSTSISASAWEGFTFSSWLEIRWALWLKHL